MTREELNKDKQSEIISEERREKRKKVVCITFKIILALVIIFSTFYILNDYIFTKKILVKEERIVNEKIPDSFNGLKVVQFSDLQYGSTVFLDEVKELVKIINSRNPDIVIFTGDLIDKNYDISDKDKEKFIHEISKLKASIGKYSVFGDEDSDDYSSIIKQAGFNLLDNSYDLVYDGDKTPIIIIGISSLLSNNYDIDAAFSYFKESNSNSNLYSIVVFHEPDLTDYVLKNKNADLLLAGHSHNGYVKLPFVNGLIKSDGAMEYYDERYEFSNSKLFISSGIGTNGSGVRFMCQPSVNFFRLSSK